MKIICIIGPDHEMNETAASILSERISSTGGKYPTISLPGSRLSSLLCMKPENIRDAWELNSTLVVHTLTAEQFDMVNEAERLTNIFVVYMDVIGTPYQKPWHAGPSALVPVGGPVSREDTIRILNSWVASPLLDTFLVSR